MKTADMALGGAPWLAGLAGMIGLALPYLWLSQKKDKTMTKMEKAFAALVEVLCGKLAEQDAELEELRKRPTREEHQSRADALAEARKELADLKVKLAEPSMLGLPDVLKGEPRRRARG